MRTFCQYITESKQNLSIEEEGKDAIQIPIKGDDLLNHAGLITLSNGFKEVNEFATYNGTNANGKFHIFTTDENGVKNGKMEKVVYFDSGMPHREDGPAIIEQAANNKTKYKYKLHGRMLLVDDGHRIEINDYELTKVCGYIMSSERHSAVKIGIAILRKYPKDFCKFIVKNNRYIIPILLEKLDFKFAVLFLTNLLQDNIFNDYVAKSLRDNMPPELEYDILSKHPQLANKMHQCDHELLKHIEEIDKKYGLDFAEEIKARLA